MKVTFLGTGTSQGIPVIACNCAICKSSHSKDKRLRTSVMLEYDSRTIVIDAGPDFRQQMLRESVMHLDAILLTHEHKDHIGGIDDVRAFNYKSQKAIDIYCDSRVESAIRREFQYVFETSAYRGAPKMNLHQLNDNAFQLLGKEVIPLKAYHNLLPVYGFRIDDLVYLTDVNAIPESSLELLKGTKFLIINALRKEKHPSHFNLREALDLIEYIKPTLGFLTHIGHEMGFHDKVSGELPDNVELAYDGLVIDTESLPGS